MKISFIFGTRPEAIKLAPVIHYFKKDTHLEVEICVTGQHKEMLKQVMDIFNITATINLSLMVENQSLSSFTAKAVTALDQYFSQSRPDVIFVQGDTSTVFAASLSAFYHKIKVFHVEAGLRTYDKYAPFPEEINRKLTSVLADHHFAPTNYAKENLLKEGILERDISVTGNTGIDALINISNRVETDPSFISTINESISIKVRQHEKVILITGHRRENFGKGFEEICDAILILAKEFPEYLFVYPVHMNPNVRHLVLERLSGVTNIELLSPQTYVNFVYLMRKAYLILTDSGGVQEEAPSLGKPILVMRNTTERPEGINAGCAKLVGASQKTITQAVRQLLIDKSVYNKMTGVTNPYGDGKASEKIYNFFKRIINEEVVDHSL